MCTNYTANNSPSLFSVISFLLLMDSQDLWKCNLDSPLASSRSSWRILQSVLTQCGVISLLALTNLFNLSMEDLLQLLKTLEFSIA